MSHHVSFWQRFGRMMRGETPSNGYSSQATNGTLAARNGHSGNMPEAPAKSGLLRWGRGGAMSKSDGLARVAELMDAMQDHFEKQDQRAEQLAGSVERVAGMISQLADAQRGQGEHIRSIAQHAEAATRQAATLSDSLGKMPASMQAQADALRSVARQLEIAQEADGQLGHSLHRFGQAVDALNASGSKQVETLQQMNRGQDEQREALTALVREQSRRFLVIMIIAAVLGIGALAAMGLTLALLLQRGA